MLLGARLRHRIQAVSLPRLTEASVQSVPARNLRKFLPEKSSRQAYFSVSNDLSFESMFDLASIPVCCSLVLRKYDGAFVKSVRRTLLAPVRAFSFLSLSWDIYLYKLTICATVPWKNIFIHKIVLWYFYRNVSLDTFIRITWINRKYVNIRIKSCLN